MVVTIIADNLCVLSITKDSMLLLLLGYVMWLLFTWNLLDVCANVGCMNEHMDSNM